MGVLRIDVGGVLQIAEAAEGPGLVLQQRAADGERRVGGVEARIRVVFVRANQVVVLEEVIGRAGVVVRPRLGDDGRDQARGADVFGRDAAGDDLLLLDDFGVQVGAKRAGDRVGDVDAFEVIEVVGRHAEVVVGLNVLPVHARTRRGVTGRVLAVRHHARNELQEALIRTAGRQRLGQPQRDVLPRRRALDVDDRRRRGHLHRLVETGDLQRDAQRRGLPRTHEHVLLRAVRKPRQHHHHAVLGRRRERFQYRRAGAVGYNGTLGDGVGCLGSNRDSRKAAAILILNDDLNRARGCDLCKCGSRQGDQQCNDNGTSAFTHECFISSSEQNSSRRSATRAKADLKRLFSNEKGVPLTA